MTDDLSPVPDDSPEELPEQPRARFRDLTPDDGSWWGNLIAIAFGAVVLLATANAVFDAVGDRLSDGAKTAIFYGLWIGPAPLLLRRHRGTWPTWRLLVWSVLIVPWFVPVLLMAILGYTLAGL